MAGKIRVYELARELGLTNKETLDLCDALGVGVKSHSSSIVDAQADRIRRKADKEGLRREVQPEEPGKPAKAGKGDAAADADSASTSSRSSGGGRIWNCVWWPQSQPARTDSTSGASRNV